MPTVCKQIIADLGEMTARIRAEADGAPAA
jgi:hypothetical protein